MSVSDLVGHISLFKREGVKYYVRDVRALTIEAMYKLPICSLRASLVSMVFGGAIA